MVFTEGNKGHEAVSELWNRWLCSLARERACSACPLWRAKTFGVRRFILLRLSLSVLALSDLGLHRGTAGIQARGYAESSETMKTEDYPPSPQQPRGARSEWCG